MIYATIDVDLVDHEKAVMAGAAMYLWTWGMLWLRKHKGDGFLPSHVVLASSWGGRTANAKAAAQLTKSGLWEATDGGWRVHNYARKNDSRETIEARIEATRAKQEAYRARKNAASLPKNDHPVTGNAEVALGVGVGVGVGASDLDQGGAGGGPERTPPSSGPRVADCAPPPPTIGDGLFGMTVDAWCEGVRSVTGKPFIRPIGGNLQQLLATLNGNPPEGGGDDRVAWARELGGQFARAYRGRTISAWAFNDWMGSGRLPARTKGPPVQPMADVPGGRVWEPKAGAL